MANSVFFLPGTGTIGGDLSINGNVGIGVPSPNGPLEIASTAWIQLGIRENLAGPRVFVGSRNAGTLFAN